MASSSVSFFFFNCICLLFYFWLCWVFTAAGLFSNCRERGLQSSCCEQASHCGGFSHGAQALGRGLSGAATPGPQSTGSVVVAHRLSCSAAWGIFQDQGSNLYLLHWQADSSPLSHEGSPHTVFYPIKCCQERTEIKPKLSCHQILLQNSYTSYSFNGWN